MRLTHRVAALIAKARGDAADSPPPGGAPTPADAPAGHRGIVAGPPDAVSAILRPVGGPGAAAADGDDPCGPAREAVTDACSLADRMNALALAAQERLREARRAYDEHAGRRERAAAAADPRAVRAAKDEAQAMFRRARLAAAGRGTSRRPRGSGSARSTASTPARARPRACSLARIRRRATCCSPSNGSGSRPTGPGSRPRARPRRAATRASRSPPARSGSASGWPAPAGPGSRPPRWSLVGRRASRRPTARQARAPARGRPVARPTKRSRRRSPTMPRRRPRSCPCWPATAPFATAWQRRWQGATWRRRPAGSSTWLPWWRPSTPARSTPPRSPSPRTIRSGVPTPRSSVARSRRPSRPSATGSTASAASSTAGSPGSASCRSPSATRASTRCGCASGRPRPRCRTCSRR